MSSKSRQKHPTSLGSWTGLVTHRRRRLPGRCVVAPVGAALLGVWRVCGGFAGAQDEPMAGAEPLLEQFVLAPDRGEWLKRQLPDSHEYFFLRGQHALPGTCPRRDECLDLGASGVSGEVRGSVPQRFGCPTGDPQQLPLKPQGVR